ncbi:SDR family NAD(P)-dependent oxidoreductase [Sutcliffiella halmapala]|uniref:SDR family NAD(P)-dependent oxidoreductase n=1 Tax=Sutcliffiella halmapala TaxID=79882 RepID=UPI000995045F|nr:SDR family NAD(P)-dependent oxidoreductase [Sutcliffiella halmapala]
MDNFSDLNGKKILITGGSKGIGKAIALAFAKLGAEIMITGRNETVLIETVKELQEFQPSSFYLVADIQDVQSVYQMVDATISILGGLDIVINNAGVNIAKPALEVTEDDWDQVLDTNLKGTFFCSQRAAQHMVKHGGGNIINIVSQMAFVGYVKRAAYCSSKGGAVQLTKALAVEWATSNVKVNAVAPTFVKTELTNNMLDDQVFYQDVLNRIPLGKLAEVSDITGAVLFLASDMARFITGETIKVDGGWTAI